MSIRSSQQPDSQQSAHVNSFIEPGRSAGQAEASLSTEKKMADAREKSTKGAVRLTGQRIFCGVCLLLVLMPLVFMGGVLAGRSQLEKELAAESPMAALTEEQQTQTEKTPQQDTTEGAKEEKSGDAILKPQELTFARVLRAAPGEKVPEFGKIRPLEPVKPRVPKPIPDGDQLGQQVLTEPVMAPGMSPAVESGPPEPPTQEADLFDFVFQVAAFHSAAKAEEMRMRIEAEGFRSRMEKSGRLYVVLLLSRGPKSRVQEVREVLQHMRLGEPIERSRRPVFKPLGQR